MPLSLLGTGVSRGIAIGKALGLQHGHPDVTEYILPPHLVEEEVTRFEIALAAARQQLHAIRTRIPADAPADIAAFIDTHLLMLEDATLARGPIEIIRGRHCNAEWALKLQQKALVKVFDEMDDPYLRTRRDDIEHVVIRIQRILMEEPERHDLHEQRQGGRIIIADDISPGDLVLLHQQGIAAVVTEYGGPTSHTAILARSLGLPALVGVHRAYQFISDDETVVVDGDNGILLAGLDAADLDYFEQRRQAAVRARTQLGKLRHRPATTRNGKHISLLANIELPDDMEALQQVGAAGVGLYRTEFLYLNRAEPPDEEEQYRIYRNVVEHLGGRPLTIRTLDLGADKQPDGVVGAATNPALGLRAVRLCLKEIALFRPQLRAILRASAHGPVRILLPMLTTVSELLQVRALLEDIKWELQHEERPFAADIPIGGMVEVPATALCADLFAHHLDFFSIGTNDLIQYTLATDRVDDEVNYLYDPLNPAVLRLIRMTLEAGRQAGVPVSMCGEMAGDPTYTRLLLGMGLTEFSMPPTALLQVKHIVTTCDPDLLGQQVETLLTCHEPERMIEVLEQLNRDIY